MMMMTACIQSKVYENVAHPSICPIWHLHATAAGLLLWAWRAGNRLLQQQQANVGSAMLSAYVGS